MPPPAPEQVREERAVEAIELTAGHVWMMVCAGLVLLMTPGLAFFYGGLVLVVLLVVGNPL
mgnify:CR=1 FL=1